MSYQLLIPHHPQTAILATLRYAQIFSYPLTQGEIYRYTITPKPLSFHQFATSLHQLVTQGKIITSSAGRVGESPIFFALPSSSHLFKTRTTREKYSHEKMKITRRVGKWLKFIPSIQAVYLTGALSMNNTNHNDDIDLMIITRAHTLWLTRICVTTLLELLHIRRKPEHQTSATYTNKICANLYLDETAIKLKSSQQNLYIAHEIIQAKPLWQRRQIHTHFLWINRWLSSFLPHSPLPYQKPHPLFPQTTFSFINSLIKPLENLAFWVQLKYMKNKHTSEVIEPQRAFFHPRNTAQQVLNQFSP